MQITAHNAAMQAPNSKTTLATATARPQPGRLGTGQKLGGKKLPRLLPIKI